MSLLCLHCGMPIKSGFKFCNVCGAPVVADIEKKDGVEPYSDLLGSKGRTVRAVNGAHAAQFFPAYPAVSIGTGAADIVIDDDETVSPLHARIACQDGQVLLQDMGALNGVFLRIRDKVTLQNNDIIRAGDSYLLIECLNMEPFSDESGTDFYASPCRGENFRLVEILRGGRRGRACVAPDGGIIVGRSEGDFLFPDDRKMSPKHFTIRWTQRGGIVIDNSSNGTFVQIHNDTPLVSGDIFFAGERLFQLF